MGNGEPWVGREGTLCNHTWEGKLCSSVHPTTACRHERWMNIRRCKCLINVVKLMDNCPTCGKRFHRCLLDIRGFSSLQTKPHSFGSTVAVLLNCSAHGF